MRRLLIIGSLLLAGCGRQPGNEAHTANALNNLAASNDGAAMPATNNVRETDQLFDMPESRRRTACAVADSFPNRQVPQGFYRELSQPEFDRYLQCVLAEARRDGGRVRLAGPGSFPAVGTCFSARIGMIGTRFDEDRPNGNRGTSVGFDNGLYLVDYGLVGPVARSRVGDPVRVCVAELPENCPAYDLRGIFYRTRNLRTGESWVMGNSQHICRGA